MDNNAVASFEICKYNLNNFISIMLKDFGDNLIGYENCCENKSRKDYNKIIFVKVAKIFTY